MEPGPYLWGELHNTEFTEVTELHGENENPKHKAAKKKEPKTKRDTTDA